MGEKKNNFCVQEYNRDSRKKKTIQLPNPAEGLKTFYILVKGSLTGFCKTVYPPFTVYRQLHEKNIIIQKLQT